MALREGQVVLLVPGLQGPQGAAEPGSASAVDALLEGLPLPALRRLLLRGVARAGPAGQHLEDMFFQLIGLSPSEQGGWPLAAFSRLASHEDGKDGGWLRADPVHLRPDLSKLLVFEPAALSLDEASQLAGHLNGHGEELGVRVEPVTATRWFARVDTPPRMHSVSPAMAHGEDAARCMPSGPDAARWHQTMNLAQMLLHSAPLNRQRESEGLGPINSLWFWGAGRLPAPSALLHDIEVVSDRSWARGAARFLGGCDRPLSRQDEGFRAGGGSAQIVLLDSFIACRRDGDPLAWREQLADFDARWLAPLLGAVEEGRYQSMQLYLGRGAGLGLSRKLLRRWWSPSRLRRTPLPTLLRQRLHGTAHDAKRGQ